MGTGSVQIVPDLIYRKKKGKENKEKYKIERQTKIKTRQKEPSQSKLC